MIRLPEPEKQFWLDMNVRLAEFCALRLNDQNFSKKVYRKLKSTDQTWYKLLIKELGAEYDGLFSLLQSLYHQNKTLFCQIYALKLFSDSIGNIDLIIQKAKDVLGDEYSIYEVLSEDDPRALILPIFLHDRDAIFDLYCDNVLKKSTIRTFSLISGSSGPIHTSQISTERVQRIMDAYQRAKRGDHRRIVVMWVLSQNEKIKIIFRRDKRSTTVIKKTAHNEAIKTADQKIFVFTENGSKLSAYLGREPAKTLEIAQYLAEKLFGQTITFNEEIIKKPVRVLDRFIDAILQINDPRVKLLAITVLNAPLSDQPMIEIRSMGRGLINQNIIELNSPSHALPLITNHSDLQSVTVQIQAQRFKLHFEVYGENVVIKCSNKGYNSEKKRIIEEYFNSFNMDDTNANSH
jgi:hypothetical protein